MVVYQIIAVYMNETTKSTRKPFCIDSSATMSKSINPQKSPINTSITVLGDDNYIICGRGDNDDNGESGAVYMMVFVTMMEMILTNQHDCMVCTSCSDSISDKLFIAYDRFFSMISDLMMMMLLVILLMMVIIIIIIIIMMMIDLVSDAEML